MFEMIPHQLVSFLSLTEKPIMREIYPCKEVESIHFYGITEPPEEDTIFYYLFHRSIEPLNVVLDEKKIKPIPSSMEQ